MGKLASVRTEDQPHISVGLKPGHGEQGCHTQCPVRFKGRHAVVRGRTLASGSIPAPNSLGSDPPEPQCPHP